MSLRRATGSSRPLHPTGIAVPIPATPSIIKNRPVAKRSVSYYGGPAYTFSKPKNLAELIDDLVLLYTKLVDLGVECRNGEVYLADLEDKDA